MEELAYKNIEDLVKTLKSKVGKLSSGKLAADEVENLCSVSRELYERLIILKFKAFESDVAKEEPKAKEVKRTKVKQGVPTTGEIQFDFSGVSNDPEDKTCEKEPYDDPKQRNLLDEIEERSDETLNERFATEETATVADKLRKVPIRNLKDAIGLNEKFLFINDLFAGEKENYDGALEKLNGFDNYIEADDYMRNQLISKYEWDQDQKSVRTFMELVERRYL